MDGDGTNQMDRGGANQMDEWSGRTKAQGGREKTEEGGSMGLDRAL